MQDVEDVLMSNFESWRSGEGRGAGVSDIEAACAVEAAAKAKESTQQDVSSPPTAEMAEMATADDSINDAEVLLDVNGDKEPQEVPVGNTFSNTTAHRRKRSSAGDTDASPASNTEESVSATHREVYSLNDLEQEGQGGVAVCTANGSRSSAKGRVLNGSRAPNADAVKCARAEGTVEMEGVENCELDTMRPGVKHVREEPGAPEPVWSARSGLFAQTLGEVDGKPGQGHFAAHELASRCSNTPSKKLATDAEVVEAHSLKGGNTQTAGMPNSMASSVPPMSVTAKAIDAVAAGMSEADLCERPAVVKSSPDKRHVN